MEAKLEKKFSRLQNDLQQLLAYMDSLPANVLHQRPDGAWSAVQILYHLTISERGTVGYVNKKLSDAEAKIDNAGFGAMLRSFLLQRALRNKNKKYRAPKMVADVPEQPDYQETKQNYLATRDDMKRMLGQFDKVKIGKAYFKHPRAGKMNIVQAMEFIQEHFDRHLEQIYDRSKQA